MLFVADKMCFYLGFVRFYLFINNENRSFRHFLISFLLMLLNSTECPIYM